MYFSYFSKINIIIQILLKNSDGDRRHLVEQLLPYNFFVNIRKKKIAKLKIALNVE